MRQAVVILLLIALCGCMSHHAAYRVRTPSLYGWRKHQERNGHDYETIRRFFFQLAELRLESPHVEKIVLEHLHKHPDHSFGDCLTVKGVMAYKRNEIAAK